MLTVAPGQTQSILKKAKAFDVEDEAVRFALDLITIYLGTDF